MTAEEKKQYKAKQLRYKKPIASNMNYQFLVDELYEMQDVIQDVQWYCEDEDNLVNALDGDGDETPLIEQGLIVTGWRLVPKEGD